MNKYKNSCIPDIFGSLIKEGDIIRDGSCGSKLDENYFCCVVEDKGQFYSCIYSDWDHLSRYDNLEIIGHCEDYKHLLESTEDFAWSGNLGEAVK